MPDADLVDKILAGRFSGENPRDLLFMVTRTAFAMFSAPQNLPNPASGQRWMDFLEQAGKLLCPLTDLAKPDTLQPEMEKMRRQYAGIWADISLQTRFSYKVTRTARKGLLLDLANSMRNGLPRLLARDASQFRGEVPNSN